jgi:alpha-N-arabinofuranosidase
LLEEVYNLEDALVVAQFLMAFIRNADFVRMACIAQIVNVIAPVLTRTEGGVLKQSIWYPFELISRLAMGAALALDLESPTYSAGERGETPILDAAATLTQSGTAAFFAVNRSTEDELEVRISGRFIGAEAYGLGGSDPKGTNSWEHPLEIESRPFEVAMAPEGISVTVPAAGFVAISAKVDVT